jgi:hypothetical protein
MLEFRRYAVRMRRNRQYYFLYRYTCLANGIVAEFDAGYSIGRNVLQLGSREMK